MISLPLLASVLGLALVVAFALAGWRMVKGPTFADRFIALDMLTAVAVGFSAVAAVGTGRSGFLDVGLGIALINFVGTAAFATFLERKGEDR